MRVRLINIPAVITMLETRAVSLSSLTTQLSSDKKFEETEIVARSVKLSRVRVADKRV